MSAPVSKAIDPARTGLSKSLMTTPCERKGVYGETVRDAAGRRLSFPLPERVTFGTAVDEAVAWLVYEDRTNPGWIDETPLDVVANDARIVGQQAAMKAKGWPLVDPEVFQIQLDTALRKYLVDADGFARLRALYDEGLMLQGIDGESLRAGDVIGTPDFVTPHRVLDLKTWSRNDGAKKVLTSPEMGIYAYLYAAHFGYLPDSVGYQAYIRVARPYWTWIEVDDPALISALVVYGRETADHWRALLAAGDIRLASVNTSFCGDCPWREAMPDLGHAGCAVGQLVPVEEVAA